MTSIRRLNAVLLPTAVLLAGLAFSAAKGVVSPRVFAIACLVVMVVVGIILFVLVKRIGERPDDGGTADLHPPSVRGTGKYVRMAALSVLIIFSLWHFRGGPWLPRMVGMCIGVTLLWLFSRP
jgi:hypothetical protein